MVPFFGPPCTLRVLRRSRNRTVSEMISYDHSFKGSEFVK